jgi:hypothetical protein
MILRFKAAFVHVQNMLDGEILQVVFDTLAEEADEDSRRTPQVTISRNFEFPGGPQIEWHDGTEYDGGAAIRSVVFDRDRVTIEAGGGTRIEIEFSLTDLDFTATKRILKTMLGSRMRSSTPDPEPFRAPNRARDDDSQV